MDVLDEARDHLRRQPDDFELTDDQLDVQREPDEIDGS